MGKQLGHYEILELLGKGGMGEVYRARDTRLNREVALKMLPEDQAQNPDRRKRFQREAEAIASLNHPHIVTIHSVEETGSSAFITMELVEGQSLNLAIDPKGMNLSRMLDLAIPIADAVAYAHTKGITHRDLKPANIIVTPDGRPKILDFGLAKVFAPQDTEAMETMAMDESLTGEGRVVGTVAYMSPEQAEGKEVDSRSDIFSLGILLYELATGQRPFQGETSISTVSSILKDSQVSVHEINPSLPRHLGRIIDRCLQKDPSKRYQVALDLKNELDGLKEESTSATFDSAELAPKGSPFKRWPVFAGAVAVVLVGWLGWNLLDGGKGSRDQAEAESPQVPAQTAGVQDDRTRIVVLPFENLGPQDQAYFAAGVTDEIANSLAGRTDLSVISRTSARQYEGSAKSVAQIAQELDVDYVVEGTVRWQQSADGTGRIRVSPKLVRTSDEAQVWTEQYDESYSDVFDIQSSIAQSIVAEMGLSLNDTPQTESPTENMGAYAAYIQAQAFGYAAPAERDYQKSLELYERAVTLDPTFVLAWADYSITHCVLYHEYVDRTEDRLSKALDAADRAAEIDPDHPYVHVARGFYYYYGRQDYTKALEFMEKGKADPRSHAIKGYIYRRLGRIEEALAMLEENLSLNPRDVNSILEVASTSAMLREWDKAYSYADRIKQMAPESQVGWSVMSFLIESSTGDLGAARSEYLSGPAPDADPTRAFALALLALPPEEAIRVLDTLDLETFSTSYDYIPKSLGKAIVSSITPDDVRTQSFAREARDHLEAVVRENPTDVRMRAALGMAYALLGMKQEAIREASRSVDMMPLSRDHLRGTQALKRQALVFAAAGEHEKALQILEDMLNLPIKVSLQDFRAHPLFRELRDHPRFVALLNAAV